MSSRHCKASTHCCRAHARASSPQTLPSRAAAAVLLCLPPLLVARQNDGHAHDHSKEVLEELQRVALGVPIPLVRPLNHPLRVVEHKAAKDEEPPPQLDAKGRRRAEPGRRKGDNHQRRQRRAEASPEERGRSGGAQAPPTPTGPQT
eukprot:TRINITY_DN1261_c0_g1_i3.p1 TRINITY_DN1261_c0_g1~~TRINITY_DN1261_c0_g1_i3.p1  ORF type:complete len:147 (+),score=12.26 TRINITY_DN1261_c0_g1_i3:237-677(+)